jgi:peroxiredoxin
MGMSQEEIEDMMGETNVLENEHISDDTNDILDDMLDNFDVAPDYVNEYLDNSGLKGILNDEVIKNKEVKKDDKTTHKNRSDTEKNGEGEQFSLPSSKKHKVVNQLQEVAEDSEIKASQIFDALSFILDENEKVSDILNNHKLFVDSQIVLLEKVTNKFPKIELFHDSLKNANELKTNHDVSLSIISGENNKIYEAMEIMQYHDINRQKIERVMSVIKKLATYLNGIFENNSNKPEVQIAKNISGDSSNIIDENAIDDLVSELSKEV